MFPGSRNVPNVPDVPNVPNDVPNIPGHVGRDGLLAEGYVAKISMLRLNIGSGMLRLSSCMLRLGLRLSIGSCMLRLRIRLSFRGSGWPPTFNIDTARRGSILSRINHDTF